jgi:hypothetical protein
MFYTYPDPYPKLCPTPYPSHHPEPYPCCLPESYPSVLPDTSPESLPELYASMLPRISPKRLPELYPDTYPIRITRPYRSLTQPNYVTLNFFRPDFWLPDRIRPPYLTSLPNRVTLHYPRLFTQPYPITFPGRVPFN